MAQVVPLRVHVAERAGDEDRAGEPGDGLGHVGLRFREVSSVTSEFGSVQGNPGSGNRNFKGPFWVNRKVPKNPLRGQSAGFTV